MLVESNLVKIGVTPNNRQDTLRYGKKEKNEFDG
jgi:hypothetical protein